MKEGLTPLFTADELDRWMERFQKKAEEKMIILLSAGGEKFVQIARNYGSYKDHTGNLRSSVGYVISKGGQVLKSNFQGNGSLGKEMGHRVASDLSLTYTGGYILIGVAGMEYAASVEAKGYEVVTGASEQCNKYLRQAVKSVMSKI